MIYFIVKPNTDLSQYGFIESTKEWVLWRNTRRLWVNKQDHQLHFNMITNECLKIFHDMIKDGVVECKDRPYKPTHYHYVGLNDDEYEIIMKERAKKI